MRRSFTAAGPQLERPPLLTRSEAPPRNRRKAERLSFAYDDLEERITQIAEQEELNAIRPDLDGEQIMQLLGIAPGPVVGRAYKFLLNLRLDEGPLGEEAATARLRQWWKEQPEAAGQPD